ncbi:hypothetical protein GOB57_23850 [Sinorhizobium meliloti]|nr:hypothetical protein [Sinorhizobium meliloti]
MNMMMLDERVLFPGPVLGGLARIVLSRRMPDVSVHGLRSHGANSICIAVAQNALPFNLGVRLKIDRKGFAFVTSVHRRVKVGDGFGSMQDEKSIFLQDEPDERVVLHASLHAFQSFWETGLRGVWDRDKVAAARFRINEAIRRGGYPETFLAKLPGGGMRSVFPLNDLSRYRHRRKSDTSCEDRDLDRHGIQAFECHFRRHVELPATVLLGPSVYLAEPVLKGDRGEGAQRLFHAPDPFTSHFVGVESAFHHQRCGLMSARQTGRIAQGPL